jgi:hypothetical protein
MKAQGAKAGVLDFNLDDVACSWEALRRGEVIRLVQTLRGGDRPKGAEKEFPGVSVMARSCWEPWGIFRKPFTGTVPDNLHRWAAGGLRRVSDAEPFRDVVCCSPTRGREKEIAPHPFLKPQRFLRQIVRASLPLGIGILFDPFAGSARRAFGCAFVGGLSGRLLSGAVRRCDTVSSVT